MGSSLALRQALAPPVGSVTSRRLRHRSRPRRAKPTGTRWRRPESPPDRSEFASRRSPRPSDQSRSRQSGTVAATQTETDGQDTAHTSPPEPTRALLQERAPPVGSVDVTTSPASVAATQSETDGHETPSKPTSGGRRSGSCSTRSGRRSDQSKRGYCPRRRRRRTARPTRTTHPRCPDRRPEPDPPPRSCSRRLGRPAGRLRQGYCPRHRQRRIGTSMGRTSRLARRGSACWSRARRRTRWSRVPRNPDRLP